MAKTIELLLTDNVDNLGIVGDVVKVKSGYARNYLLPRDLATTPSEELVAQLAEKRKVAQQQVAELRAAREDMVTRLDGYELALTRSCNDQGILYAAVTQTDIAKALNDAEFDVRPRDVRLSHGIKRLDSYDVHIKFAQDLEAHIKLSVTADREMEEDEREEMEFDDEGELIVKTNKPKKAEATADDAPAEEPSEDAAD